MWTREQHRELDETGVVRLPGAVPAPDVEAMRERLWQELSARHGLRPDAPDWTASPCAWPS